MTNWRKVIQKAIEQTIGTQFWSLYQSGRHYDQLPENAQKAAQRQSLVEIVQHAASHVPLWRTRLAAQRPDWFARFKTEPASAFQELPFTTKSDIREGFPESVTSDSLRDQWRYGSSAGTIDRVTVITDFRKRDYLRAANLRLVDKIVGHPLRARIVEIPPDACNVVCALRDEGPLDLVPYVSWALKKRILFKKDTRSDLRGRVERSLIVRQETLKPIAPKAYGDLIPQLDQHLDRIQKSKPNILRGLPHFLMWMAHRARDRNENWTFLKAILPYGGLMSEAIASRVTDAFQTPFVDYYGTSEFGPIALQQPGEEGMRVFHDLFLVEVVDRNNLAVPVGQPGRILLTDLHNQAMPLIRYAIGDCGRWIADESTGADPLDRCRHARLQILGRQSESIDLPSGKTVTAREVMNVLFADPAILNASVECRDDHSFTLKSMSTTEIASTTLEGLARLLENPCSLRSRSVSYLRPEPSGKFQVVKQHQDQRSDGGKSDR